MWLPGLLPLLNHLLSRETWATARLQAFAGESLLIAFGHLHLGLTVTSEGLFCRCPPDVSPSVQIQLPADLPLRSSLLASARISGSAEFSETLAFVFRHLQVDVESELADILGDMAARRLTQAGRLFYRWQRDASTRLLANAAEYLREESASLVPGRDLQGQQERVKRLGQALAQLESRIGRLEKAPHA